MRKLLLAALLVLLFASPAKAVFELGDIICETTATTGTGTINLAGAVTNYATFVSQITSAATVPYTLTSGDGKVETGIGTFTDATPDTLSRTANWSTDGSGAELTLSGTSTVCLGPIEQVFLGGVLQPGFLALELGSGVTTDTTIARSAAGEATLEGDAIKHAGKQMIFIPAAALRNNATSPASCGDTYDSGSNDLTVTVCAFDTGATEERADWQIAMPKSWNEGTFTFITNSTCTGCSAAQTIQFELACVAISHDDTLNVAMGTPQSSAVTVTATNDSHISAESSAITCAGTPAENDYVAFRISRDTSADNAAGDVLLLGIRLFWTDNAATLAE